MLEVLKFILKCLAQILNMLFEIDLGFASLGTLMCIIFIFLPLVLLLVNILKYKLKGDWYEYIFTL